eukprot:Lithocolla_globosa_v1_NODE_11547_length_500_cov_3.220225.p2 type:complete len:111 gc:universal NODE_11547_length_500_cov_3.220225:373-41(-)
MWRNGVTTKLGYPTIESVSCGIHSFPLIPMLSIEWPLSQQKLACHVSWHTMHEHLSNKRRILCPTVLHLLYLISLFPPGLQKQVKLDKQSKCLREQSDELLVLEGPMFVH